jgi:hypothetical protein
MVRRGTDASMRVLIITDSIFAAREWEMFSRLEVGLATEGIAVAHAVPAEAVAHVMGSGESPVFSTLIPFTHSSVPFTLGLRAQRLVSALRDRLDLEEDEPAFDLVHAFGGQVVPLAVEAARREETPAVIEVWRSGAAKRLAKVLRPGKPRTFLSAPDAAVEREILSARLAETAHTTTRVVPWGVHMPEWVRAAPLAAQTFSAMVIGSGHDAGALAAALEGLVHATPKGRELMVFIDAAAGRRGRLWRVANRLGIAGAVSFVDNLEARRDLLVAGDVLLCPEARGEHRTALLEAFAGEMVVVAAEDRGVSCLREGETARMVRAATPGAWAEVLSGLFAEPGSVRTLTASARAYVERHHLASAQVRALIELYTSAASGGGMGVGTVTLGDEGSSGLGATSG